MFLNPHAVLEVARGYVGDYAEGLTIADFGCGEGDYVIAAAKAMQGNGRVYAVDIQKPLLDRVNAAAQSQEIDNVYTVWADFEVLGATAIPEKSLDLVLVINTMFQLEDKDGFARELDRLAKESAVLVMVDWIDSFNGLGPQADHVFNSEAALNWAEDNGWNVQTVVNSTDHHYIMVARHKK